MDGIGSLRNRVAVVTGAGRGIAAALAENGATVYATGRTVVEASLPEAARR